MVVVTVLKFALVAGTIYLTKELGVWNDPQTPGTERMKVKKMPNTHQTGGQKDMKNILFDDDDKKDLQRKMDEYRKKYCHKGGICEPPPPKTWSETVEEAWSDTVRVLKKIPAYWDRAFKDISESISELFSSTKEK